MARLVFDFHGHECELFRYVETISSRSLDAFHGNPFGGSAARQETSFQVLKAKEEDVRTFHYRRLKCLFTHVEVYQRFHRAA